MVQDAARARWRRLGEGYGVDVTLLVPERWESNWFGRRVQWNPQRVEEGRFHVLPLSTTSRENWGRYLFVSIDGSLRHLHPDAIVVMQEELSFVLHQMITYRGLWAPRARLLFFSWNNRRVPLANWYDRLMWRRTCEATDLALAGNQEVKQVLGKAGYLKPIAVQTEIGVDERLFRPDPVVRSRSRQELGLSGFVVGYVGRLVEDKGITDLWNAARELEGDWTLLVVGDGPSMKPLRLAVASSGQQGRVHFTGLVCQEKVASLIQAMDCLVLPTRTTPSTKEQFGLVLAQAMACAVPVIGSDSGAIPEVIGESGLVFVERDVEALRRDIRRLREDHALRERLARGGFERCTALYSATALADQTYELCTRLCTGVGRAGGH